MKRLISILAGLFCCLLLHCQEEDIVFFTLPDDITDEYLDSVKIEKIAPNDYWMAGVYGGASAQYGYFNPYRPVTLQIQYPVFGFSFIKYYTMFGVFHNVGLEFGAQQNYEGYEFKLNKETGRRPTESGAYKAMIKVPEAFFLSHFHYDTSDSFKLLAKVGFYTGYRTSIQRVLEEGFEAYSPYVNEFRDYDRRWSYGLHGGVGAAVMLDPFEIHMDVRVKWGWESFWQPENPLNHYYYRFAYPLDVNLTFGIYYQLTPRHGHSRAQLRRMAKDFVNSTK